MSINVRRIEWSFRKRMSRKSSSLSLLAHLISSSLFTRFHFPMPLRVFPYATFPLYPFPLILNAHFPRGPTHLHFSLTQTFADSFHTFLTLFPFLSPAI